VWFTMQPGEIFGRLGDFIDERLPDFLYKPIAGCPICMVPYYGSVLYWVIWHVSWQHWLITVIASMGLNVVIVKLFPKDD
jgi:hypothetical protein